MSGKHKPEHIKKVLSAYLRKSKLHGKIGTREIYAIWPEVVGDEIAAHTKITAIRKGTLSVAVDSAALFYELSTVFGEEIRGKLNKCASKDFISRINFHLDTV